LDTQNLGLDEGILTGLGRIRRRVPERVLAIEWWEYANERNQLRSRRSDS
jgi:hypothetical protein